MDLRKKIRQLLIVVILVAVFVPITFNIMRLISMMYDSLIMVGEEGILLSLGISISSFIIFFFGLFYLMNTFYFANDVETLLPLPVKSSQIIGAKFIVVILFEYLTETLFLLPILIVFGIKTGGSLIFILYALLIYLTLPVIPIFLASFIIMLIMRFTNIAKNKDLFRMVSAFIAIFISIGMNMTIQRFAGETNFSQIKLGNNSLVEATSSLFPTAKIGAIGLLNSGNIAGLTNILLFIALSLVGYFLTLLLGNLLYFKGVSGVSNSTGQKKQFNQADLQQQSSQRSIMKSYILKEFKILLRTPAYFINCILMNFLWPLFILIPFISQKKSMPRMDQISQFFQNPDIASLIVTVTFAVIMVISSTNGIAATAISREGDNLFVNKFIPVPYLTQILAKIIPGMIMGMVSLACMCVPAFFLLKLPIHLLLIVCVTSLPGIVFCNFIGIILDLYNPKLVWDNEQKAVKQNLNLLLAMVVCALIGGLTVFAVYQFKIPLVEAVSAILLLYGIMDILLYQFLSKKGAEIFSRIEI